MKRHLLLILTVSLLLCAPVWASEKAHFWPIYDLTGGTSGTLDGAISGVSINKNDMALVIRDFRAYVYSATTSDCTDDGFNCIAPDDVGAGVTRWELCYWVSGTTVPTIIIPEPDQLDDINEHPIWKNDTGTTFWATSIQTWGADSGTTCTLAYSASEANMAITSGTSIWTTLWPSTAGTNGYYGSVASGATGIPPNRWLLMDFNGDTPDWMALTIGGYYAREEQ